MTELPTPTSDLTTLSAYDYPLPKDLIARYPLARRDQSRMMHLDRQVPVGSLGWLNHTEFTDITTLLSPGDLLVVNNAKVLSSRLIGHREGHTGEVEVLLLYPDGDPLQHQALKWSCLMRPARKLSPGTQVVFPNTGASLTIEENLGEGRGIVSLHLGPFTSVDDMLSALGQLPIPPYLEREAEPSDQTTYQTVYAKTLCAQAAPTAGLHFTPEVLEALEAKGVQRAEITLAVGLGTFRPVTTDRIDDHVMDPEFYHVEPSVLEQIQNTRAAQKRVIAVGTTVVKTLETLARQHPAPPRNGPMSGWSDLFITPGFEFQWVDGMLTNFHLPKSTLMMLVSAFAGHKRTMDAYREAVQARYRFYSYGDCMLIT